jgi:hypothetical protein
MLISIGGAGRLGNNILLAADLSALALEHDLELEVLGLRDMVRHLNGSGLARIRLRGENDSPQTAFRLLRNPRVANALRWATAHRDWPLPLLSVVNDREEGCPATGYLVQLARRTRVLYVGWNFRAQELLVRNQAAVRALLQFRSSVTSGVRARMQQLRKGQGTVLGIHVRRGDYRAWCNGRFHFDDQTYQQLAMKALGELGTELANPRIMVVSDEPTAWPSELSGVPVMRFEGAVIEDLAALSMCDRILGPPSTFAMSASLIGQVPFLQVSDPLAPICVDRFFTYGSEVFPQHARIEHLLRPESMSTHER